MTADQRLGESLPISEFVLKIHSRCDLACDHCYMYEHADQSWRSRPVVMSDDTIERTAARIAEHALARNLTSVNVVFHGGEPLLAGPERLSRFATVLRDALARVCRIRLSIQTNGLTLNKRMCEVLADHDIKVGISLDGDRVANDRHRRYANGRSSYEQVMQAIDLLSYRNYRHLFGGLLCTIDIANNPLAVYEALIETQAPALDLLLPNANWDTPPPGKSPEATPYADWLITIFDRWFDSGRPIPIRIFDSLLDTVSGGETWTESMGLALVNLIVVETDGTLELVDSLKSAFEGAPFTGLDVHRNSFDDAANHPGVKARQRGRSGLSETCQACPVVQSCGGGFYPHRYKSGTGFDNPSVYCTDLKKLVSHVRTRSGLKADAAVTVTEQVHQMPPAHFQALAAGYGDAHVIENLMGAQRSIRRALVAEVVRRTRMMSGVDHRGWDFLARLEQISSGFADKALAHPYTRVWAMEQLGRCVDGGKPDMGYINALAAVAAIQSGISATLPVPVSQGRMYLPGMGSMRLGHEVESVEVECGLGAFTVAGHTVQVQVGKDAPHSAGHRWLPIRYLDADGFTVALDDLDPYRDAYPHPVAPRLPDDEVDAWRSIFRDAWRIIEQDYAVYAQGMATGVTTITPFAKADPSRHISCTNRNAFGAIAVARPQDPATLVLLLLHEFQHSKLSAVFDMLDLFDETDTRLYHAPWRKDLRPLEGLLQGIYAHLAVTDFWRTRRTTVRGDERARASTQFIKWRDATAETVGTVLQSGALTPAGVSFFTGANKTLQPWLTELTDDR